MTIRKMILTHARANPGCTSVEAAEHFPALERNSISSALADLFDEGTLARYRDGRCYRYVYAPDMQVVGRAPDTDLFISPTHDLAADLARQVAELMAWRDAAIETHPDLAPPDPLLFQAREIVATIKRAENASVDAIAKLLAGEYDKGTPVQAALAALRSATT